MQSNQGFSLLELSIVLVIVGLLSGGILGGQSLIRAAELRSLTTDTSKYMTAFIGFKDKYFALPGDMTNATQFWGIAGGGNSGTAAACIASNLTTPPTCDGNGNGYIGLVSVGANNTMAEYYERFHAWKQLANAGLIEGSYTGAAGGNGSSPTEEVLIGTNIPQSRLSNVGFGLYPLPTMTGNAYWFDGNYGNILLVGTKLPNSSGGKALKPEEEWNIDTKLDDGRPATGRILGFPTTNISLPNCTTGTTVTANYNLTTTSLECSMIVLTGV